ncbi:MAG: hypothetical protein ACD_7C00575G0001 [uncultured bacterium]|nr:MAG: hypothetical protein ACD_7C00575G0001 [uncultured bacterium]
MFEKITPLQWEYLGKPEIICILYFNREKNYINALRWIYSDRIPWEVLEGKINGTVIPNAIVIPSDMLKKFQNPVRGMVGTFETRTVMME